MTVVYKPTLDQLKSVEPSLGNEVKMKVVGFGSDGEVQAVKVEASTNGITNRTPHITVAVKEGAKPAKSNELEFEEWDGPVLLGHLEAFGNTPKAKAS